MNKLIKNISYSISLHSNTHNFNKKRNIIIHHGLMGSAKNFRSISKNQAFSKYANVHLIDARNHGNKLFEKRIITTCINTFNLRSS